MANMYYMLKGDAGAVGDGSTDDTNVFCQWLVHGLTTGQALGAEPGKYKITSQLPIDWNNYTGASNQGLTIKGSGKGRTIFDMTAVTASPAFQIHNSAVEANLFLDLTGFTFEFNNNGIGFQLGNENFSDAWNTCNFDFCAQQNSNGTSAVAVEFNYVLQSKINILCGTQGNGVGFKARQCVMNDIMLSLGGNAIGLYLTGGSNVGNTFSSLDIEAGALCVQCDNSATQNNVFTAGQYNYTSHGLNFTAGSGNYFIKPNEAPAPGAGTFVNGSTGLTVV